MKDTVPEIAVILAAGFGSRLHVRDNTLKPFQSVAGRALILRVIDRFEELGIREVVVVTGYRAAEVQAGIREAGFSIKVKFAHNPKYEMSNGLSVLAAKEEVGNRSFYLSMSDHVFDEIIINGLIEVKIPEDGLVLAIDRKLETVFDMNDATKVKTIENRIVAIGKNFEEFDAVDTGLFACSPGLFDAIENVTGRKSDGDCTISEGVMVLADQKKALAHDIGHALWQDVDTPESLENARRIFGS